MRASHNLKIVEPMDDVATADRLEVFEDIRGRLEPYRTDDRAIVGGTVITKDLNIDSLAVMDMVMEIEDRYDISIPLNVVSEIHTVDELTDTVLRIRGGH